METISKADIVLDRLLNGKFYNRKLKIYSKEYLENVLEDLVLEEKYEKCVILTKIIKKRFKHKSNFKNPII